MDSIARELREHPLFGEGRAEADAEIAAGQLGHRIHGKVDWTLCDEVAAELRRRFGIDLNVNGHCIVLTDEAAKAEGYNERMKEEFVSRFGEDVIETVFREVERRQKKSRKKSKPR